MSTRLWIRYNGSHSLMFHHYLAGTFGIWFADDDCRGWFDCWFLVCLLEVFGLFDLIWLWLWLWLIDWLWSDDDLTTWWLDLMITIWLQWFEDDDDIYDHDGYVTGILMNNTLTPRFNPLRLTSTGFTSRVDIISMAFTVGFVFYLSWRGCFHYKLDL